VLIREAAAPALVIAAYRLTLASAPLALFAAYRRRAVLPKSSAQRGLTLLAGVFLACHFGFWIASVQQTSIITSVVLVTAQPLFVALASGPVLGEKPGSETWAGIALGALGALVMVSGDLGQGSDVLRGDVFALLGASFAAAYIMTGRSMRTAGSDWLPYVTSVYSIAAIILVVTTAVAGHAFGGYSARTYGFLALLALVPQLIGHTAINRSLGYLPAASVAVAILGEPVGATLLGILFLNEDPTLLQLAGAVLVLAGVYLGLRGAVARDLPAPVPD
jgi:drug/metabolite transporter (DMT)-like permease